MNQRFARSRWWSARRRGTTAYTANGTTMSVRTRERTTGCHPIVTGDATADYAGRVLDYQCAHPELARLTFWEGLELGAPVAKEQRRSRSVDKVDRILAAVPEFTREEAEELLLTILTLADASQALPNLDTIYTGARGDEARLARRRAGITTIVRTWG